MKEDPTEQTDLAASEPAMLKQLKERYAQLRATQLDQTYVEYFAVACGYGPPKPGRSAGSLAVGGCTPAKRSRPQTDSPQPGQPIHARPS